MDLQFSTMDNGIRLIKLSGKLDIIGTGEIETKFTGCCAGDKVRVVADLSGVDYIASIGIRLFMLTAKSLAKRNGKMALIKQSPMFIVCSK